MNEWAQSSYCGDNACVQWMKSSFSSSQGSCVEFHKSSFSSSQGSCVETSNCTCEGINILVRDSKDKSGPVLTFTPAEWDAFVKGVKAGEFDL